MQDLKIVIDTREKEISHIEAAFKKQGVNYEFRKLDVGDYAIEDENKLYDVRIERKASLDEIICNLLDRKSIDKESNNRFKRELIKAREKGYKTIILIENLNWYEDILRKNYRSNINPNSLRGMLLSLEHRYNITILGIDKKFSGSIIYNELYYFRYNELKNEK